MTRRVTLKAIADAAKVSIATASRALNKTGPVSPEVDKLAHPLADQSDDDGDP